jgi:hypothetical protein
MAELAELMAMSAAPTSSAVQISVVGVVQRDGVTMNYVTSALNKPKTYSNTFFVWKTTSEVLPWGTAPVKTVALAADLPVSSQKIDFAFELEQGYIIGYAVGSDQSATCATVYIPAGQHNDPKQYIGGNTTIKLNTFGSNFVQVDYDGLEDYGPQANGNWIGLWEKGRVPYSGDPMGKALIKGSENRGKCVIEGVRLTIDSTYSIGYFMSSKEAGRTALAASWTFDT